MHLTGRGLSDLLHLFYPHNCEGCGTDRVLQDQLLCAKCRQQLPATGFFGIADNPVERIFYGRCRVAAAASLYYFTKHSLLQHILVQLKYRGNRDAGTYLGRMMGHALRNTSRFAGVDMLIPLPLNEQKEYRRGYNQSAVIAHAIAGVWHKKVVTDAVTRNRFTETQTHRNRIGRWQNMQDVFDVTNAAVLANKHILLIDDVVTTGATLEACGSAILRAGAILSIATAAYTN
ncbi:ComF family protein [Sediminibacterium soli]|uniref:ComF family protein n=1 Tax=Sediminibacterium soli TaxID=2698829 RepID=UPI00137A3727|nr:phosphoribosyltransferase family protein [Sediminibacterium soli]NCI45356.1 ComF family protein [Sediminibacterium soli]